MQAIPPTSNADLAVLWHLYRRPDQEVWCVVIQVDSLFALRVCRDTDPYARPMSERYADYAAVAKRAADVKQEFLAMGWCDGEDCNVESSAPLTVTYSSG